MMYAVFIIALTLIGSLCVGASSSIGLFPHYKQPKNIRIQTILTIIGFLLILISIAIQIKHGWIE